MSGAIPAELRTRRQWVVWRLEQRQGKGTKIPYNPTTGMPASSTDPTTWTDYDTARASSKDIGFVFTDDDPYCGVDLDACVGPSDTLHPSAAEIVRELGSYTERSPSGTGLHIIVRAVLRGGRNRTPNTPWGGVFEAYSKGRYFTMTGALLDGAPSEITDAQDALDALLRRMFPPVVTPAAVPVATTHSVGDDELLSRATRAPNGGKLTALMAGNTEGYGSDSEADLALCDLLAFWAGPDPNRIDALFRRSQLYRAKWERPDYRERTIGKALEGRTDFYTPPRTRAVNGAAPETGNNVNDSKGNGSGAPPPSDEPPFRLEVMSAKAVADLPTPVNTDLLGSLVQRGQRVVVGAHTGHGKTTFCLQLAGALSQGDDFLGFKGAGGRTLIIDAEQGLKTMQKRIRETGLTDSTDVSFARVPEGLKLDSDQAQIAEVESVIAQGYDFVITDPLYKLHSGDSNAEREADDLMRLFDHWRTTYNFALLLPMHCRKPPLGAKFTMHEFFGSTAYLRGAEVVLGLQMVRQGYSKLYFFKDRDGDLPVGDVWGLLFDREQGFRRDPHDGEPKQTAEDKLRELLEADPGMTQTKLIEASGYAERTVRKALKAINADEKPGPHNSKQYFLPLEDLD